MTACAPLLAAVLAGCGDDHSYPAGFEAQAARDESYFNAQAAAKSGADPEIPTAAPDGQGAPRAAAGLMGAPRNADFGVPPAEGDAFEAAPEAVAAQEQVIAELKLSDPPAVKVVDGEEAFQKLAKDRKFDAFRRMCARYLQLKRELMPYGQKLADGTSTAEDRAMHAKIEKAMEAEFPRINRYLWKEGWSEEDRAAMGWILNGEFAPKR